ncbi:MAG: phosphoribosylanthranilate isomerase [Opitutae bacterium]|nr:phosphoribosylanthranilate isomerase [Opitutae bacterium]
MNGRISLKTCGITRADDAAAAVGLGADWLGFIFYPPSPRNLSREQYTALLPKLPATKKVAVCVEPSPAELAGLAALGFDALQVHFPHTTPAHVIGAWAETVGINRLWLAPRLPPGQDVKPEWLPLADTFLLDTFHPDKFGGTGETGDWPKFTRHREAHPGKTWILSGGLNPENIAAAVTATGAKFIDVNSGVEQAPGIKSPAKLQALVLALHNAAKHENPRY